jgi:cytosine/adenosine deaminase-related metal-dependent hydrolase
MGTLGGARALGLDRLIGSIEAGKKADLVLLETESFNMRPRYDPYSVIAYSANPGNVDSVWVNGNAAVRSGKLASADSTKIKYDFSALQAEIREYLKNCG